MSSGLAFRLARREVRRRPGRTALVMLLVAVPICGMTVGTVLVRTDTRTNEEEFLDTHGDVDAVMTTGNFGGVTYAPEEGVYYGPDESVRGDAPRPLPDLPEGSEHHTVRAVRAQITGPAGAGQADGEVIAAPTVDRPLTGTFAGHLGLVRGRTPTGEGEVALSHTVADEIDADVGDEVELALDPATREVELAHDHVDGRDPDDLEPDDPLAATVVGLVEDRECLSCLITVVAPGAELPGSAEAHEQHLVKLPSGFDDARDLAALRESGLRLRPDLTQRVADRMVLQDHYQRPDNEDDAAARWAIVLGTVALTAVGIVIAAAFAVGARRQLATLGQLSATGAAPALLRRTLMLQGTVTGLLGLLAGWGLAAVLLVLGRGRIEGWLDHRLAGWESRSVDLLGIAVVGVLAASVAALVPARSAARIPTLAALAGRRPQGPLPRRLPVAGMAAVAAGLVLLALAVLGASRGTGGNDDIWAATAVVGGVLQLLGACGVAPVIAGGLEALGTRTRGATRLAARSLGRHRARTGAVVAAVAVTAALAVFSGSLVRSYTEQDQAEEDERQARTLADDILLTYEGGHYRDGNFEDGMTLSRPPDDGLEAELGSIVPGAETRPVMQGAIGENHWEVTDAGALLTEQFRGDELELTGPTPPPVVADEALLDTFEDPSGLEEALDRSGLVVLAQYVPGPYADEEVDRHDPTVTLRTPDGNELTGEVVSDRVPGEVATLFGRPVAMVTPEVADDLDLDVTQVATVFQLPDATTEEQRRELDRPIEESRSAPTPDGLTTEEELAEMEQPLTIGFDRRSPDGIEPRTIEFLLSGMAAAVALFVVATSLALAAAEGRDERETLTVVGARPRALAGAAGAKALLLAGLGGLLALPLGLAPAAVVTRSLNAGSDRYLGQSDLGFAPPWLTILVLVVALPLAAAAAAGVGSAVAQRLRPLRVSTATFE